jgi:hypothetical protein
VTWITRWDGVEHSSDDLTLGDLDRLEQQTGVPWSALNPLREIKVAKAFLALVSGQDVEAMTLGQIKAAFDWRPDLPLPGADQDGDPDDAAPLEVPSSPASSSGASGPSAGHRGRPAGRG